MNRLKELRLAKGLTIEGLHELSGVATGTISLIETGKIRNPGMATVRKLATALGTEISNIMDPIASGE